MTHLIKDWQTPSGVYALQTTHSFADHSQFDVHPNRCQPLNELAVAYKQPHPPYFMQQVHGHTVVEYMKPPSAHHLQQADACFTRQPGVICAVMTADCLPVLLTDESGSFVAAIHCGWRSLFANILAATYAAIQPENEILCWFGPCIQQQQYEVDSAFVKNYLTKHPDCESAFTPFKNSKSQASLYTLAAIKLQRLGIHNIQQSDECTFTDKRYYSWRETQTSKRMATMIWLQDS